MEIQAVLETSKKVWRDEEIEQMFKAMSGVLTKVVPRKQHGASRDNNLS